MASLYTCAHMSVSWMHIGCLQTTQLRKKEHGMGMHRPGTDSNLLHVERESSQRKGRGQHLVVGHAHGQRLHGRADLIEDHVQRLRQHARVRPRALHSSSTPLLQSYALHSTGTCSTAACPHCSRQTSHFIQEQQQ